MLSAGYGLKRGSIFMDKWITAYQAADVLGVSKQCVYQRINRGLFVKGKMLMHKRLKKKVMHYRLVDVQAFKNRASVSA